MGFDPLKGDMGISVLRKFPRQIHVSEMRQRGGAQHIACGQPKDGRSGFLHGWMRSEPNSKLGIGR